jgi:DsbC/DsbD-like thiol-disulfide interchange protein
LQKSALATWGAATMVIFGAALVPASATEVSSAWVGGHNSRIRLFGGSLPGSGSTSQLVAGIEIKLPPGWKTYWRMPGDGGGIPPSFDWTGSTNLATAKVLYPAPKRLEDPAGDTVGYEREVLFPVQLTPKDPAHAVDLRLTAEYGICREICVPVEAKLSLSILPRSATGLPAAITRALDVVPRTIGARRETDPRLVRAATALSGEKPSLVFEVAYPGDSTGADVFVEAPDGLYIGLPRRVGKASGSTMRFELDLTAGIALEELRGKTLLVTMISDAGVSEVTWKVE